MSKITKLNKEVKQEAETLSEETLEAQKERLEKEIEAYKEKVDAVETLEELDALEEDIMKDYDKFEAHIKTVEYELPADCVFEGKRYSKADVVGKIIYFISKMEQKWQYVPGLYGICALWKKIETTKVAHPVLDSTLRLLDQCTFKGITEWRDILIVNEYMKQMNTEYSKNNNEQIALAQRHDAIIKRRDLIKPINGELKD